MPFVLLLIFFVVLAFGPQLWAKRVLARHSGRRDDLAGPMYQLQEMTDADFSRRTRKTGHIGNENGALTAEFFPNTAAHPTLLFLERKNSFLTFTSQSFPYVRPLRPTVLLSSLW